MESAKISGFDGAVLFPNPPVAVVDIETTGFSATRLQGITGRELLGAPRFVEVVDDLLNLLDGPGLVVPSDRFGCALADRTPSFIATCKCVPTGKEIDSGSYVQAPVRRCVTVCGVTAAGTPSSWVDKIPFDGKNTSARAEKEGHVSALLAAINGK